MANRPVSIPDDCQNTGSSCFYRLCALDCRGDAACTEPRKHARTPNTSLAAMETLASAPPLLMGQREGRRTWEIHRMCPS